MIGDWRCLRCKQPIDKAGFCDPCMKARRGENRGAEVLAVEEKLLAMLADNASVLGHAYALLDALAERHSCPGGCLGSCDVKEMHDAFTKAMTIAAERIGLKTP